MRIYLARDPEALGRAAAEETARLLDAAIEQRGEARLVLSTGASQFETLDALTALPVDWGRVTMFHLDEYLGMDDRHPASFRRYLRERFLNRVAVGKAVLIEGDAPDPQKMIEALTLAIRERPVDVGLIGIGENAHVAFNDPPADFDTDAAYRIVELNEECKRQQVREGWFDSVAAVPPRAISMTVHQILQCHAIISSVPRLVKAEAIRKTLVSNETPWIPATVLKRHAHWSLYLDQESAGGLDDTLRRTYHVQSI